MRVSCFVPWQGSGYGMCFPGHLGSVSLPWRVAGCGVTTERGCEPWEKAEERVGGDYIAVSKLTLQPYSLSNPTLQLPTPQPRPRTDQLPPCRPCAPRTPHPACPPPASGLTRWCPHSMCTSPPCRQSSDPSAPDQPFRLHLQRLPSHLPTSVLPTSTGRLEGGLSVACHRPAPPTPDANQMRRKMKR